MALFSVSAPVELNGKGSRGLNHWFPNHEGNFLVGVEYAQSSWQDASSSKNAMVTKLSNMGVLVGDDLHYSTPGHKAARCLKANCSKAQLQTLAGDADVQALWLLQDPV